MTGKTAKANRSSKPYARTLTRPSPAHRKPIDWEHMEQRLVFEWAAMHETRWPELRYLHATLNGARVHMGLARKLKDAGMKSGPCDIYLDVRRMGFSGLRIELKRERNKAARVDRGRPSKEQLEWLEHYTQEGFCAALCFGAQAAIDQISSYLSLPREITVV